MRQKQRRYLLLSSTGDASLPFDSKSRAASSKISGMSSPPDISQTSPTAKKFSAILEDEVADFQGTTESILPFTESNYVQLKPGPAPTDLGIFSSNTVSVLGIGIHAASVGVNIIRRDYVAFWMWDGDEDCWVNGQHCSRNVIYTPGQQDGFHITGGARKALGIGTVRSNLIGTLAALRGVGPEDVPLQRIALELSPEESARFRSDVGALFTRAIERKLAGQIGASLVDPSEAIFGLLVDAYLRASPGQVRNDRPRGPERIVRLAEERFYNSQSGPVSLADLCAAAHVSQRTLYRAFHMVCGEAPLAYFHKRRLSDARQALIHSHQYPGAVQRAALDVGLSELGRFSVEYRQLFGESPSATLRANVVA